MHHLLSILATLSLAAATPLPQYDSLTTPDIVTGDPWGTTSLDTSKFQFPFPPFSHNNSIHSLHTYTYLPQTFPLPS